MALRAGLMTTGEVTTLQRLAHSRSESARPVERAHRLCAQLGRRVPAIAQETGLRRHTVRLWRKRFNVAGLPGLQDQPYSGRRVTSPIPFGRRGDRDGMGNPSWPRIPGALSPAG